MRGILFILVAASFCGCVSYDETRVTSYICQLHDSTMTREQVRVVPGIGRPVYTSTPYPHAKRDIIAGCTVRETTGHIYVCRICDRLWQEVSAAESAQR